MVTNCLCSYLPSFISTDRDQFTGKGFSSEHCKAFGLFVLKMKRRSLSINTSKKELLDYQIFFVDYHLFYSMEKINILNLELYSTILISTLYNLIFSPNTNVSPGTEKPDRVL